MSIVQASEELYKSLRKYDEVVGTGVSLQDNRPYIVVYLQKTSKAILDKIPQIYKGNHVKTEISGSYFSF